MRRLLAFTVFFGFCSLTAHAADAPQCQKVRATGLVERLTRRSLRSSCINFFRAPVLST